MFFSCLPNLPRRRSEGETVADDRPRKVHVHTPGSACLDLGFQVSVTGVKPVRPVPVRAVAREALGTLGVTRRQVAAEYESPAIIDRRRVTAAHQEVREALVDAGPDHDRLRQRSHLNPQPHIRSDIAQAAVRLETEKNAPRRDSRRPPGPSASCPARCAPLPAAGMRCR